MLRTNKQTEKLDIPGVQLPVVVVINQDLASLTGETISSDLVRKPNHLWQSLFGMVPNMTTGLTFKIYIYPSGLWRQMAIVGLKYCARWTNNN